MIAEACHAGIVRSGRQLERGQCFISYKIIQEELCWYAGYRKETYSRSQIESAMKWYAKEHMITTMKTTRGMIITISNYNLYQDPKNYERHNETDNETTMKPQQDHTINKNDKNDKKKTLSPTYSESFERFWKVFPNGRGKQNAQKEWKKLNLDNQIDEIIKILKAQIENKDQYDRMKIFHPELQDPERWIKNKRWEDKIIPSSRSPHQSFRPLQDEESRLAGLLTDEEQAEAEGR